MINRGIGIQYNVQLQKLVKAIKKDIDESIVPLVRQYGITRDSMTTDGWYDFLIPALTALMKRWKSERVQQLAARLAGDFVVAANNASRKSVGIDIYEAHPELRDVLQSSTWSNVQLIQSIPDQYLAQVQQLVVNNMRAGLRPSAIVNQLQQQYGVTQRRAKLIARDQTSKVQGDLNEKRQRAVGFEYFQWVTSKDERVRDRHTEIAEKLTAYGLGIYRWDNLPLSDKGEPIKPGSDYQCRCFARPVSNEEVERNRRNGKTAPGVYR